MSNEQKDETISVYLGGGKGIKEPTDVNGKVVKAGDKLTWDFHDGFYKEDDIEDWMLKPIFIVEEHPSAGCLCGRGIHKELYLHDFRFKFCEVVTE